MKYWYKQWEKGNLGIGMGFDPDELGHIVFSVNVCFPHEHAIVSIALLGASFDFYWFERDEATSHEGD